MGEEYPTVRELAILEKGGFSVDILNLKLGTDAEILGKTVQVFSNESRFIGIGKVVGFKGDCMWGRHSTIRVHMNDGSDMETGRFFVCRVDDGAREVKVD